MRRAVLIAMATLAAGRPIDALSDFEIAPDPDGPGTHTAFIEFGPRPAEPAPNTLYTASSSTGQFWYRVYVPDEGVGSKGGVPLPRVTLEGPVQVPPSGHQRGSGGATPRSL